MTFCPCCEIDVHPYQDMGEDGRMRDRCGKCNAAIDRVAPVVALQVAAPVPKRAEPAAATAPTDVLAMVRTRLDVVRAEIRDVRALEAEADMLQRMLDAAAPAPLRMAK